MPISLLKMIRALLMTALFIVTLECSSEEEIKRYVFATPVDVVDQLYRDFGWEAIMSSNAANPGLAFRSREVLEKYFDDSLSTLLLTDAECVKKTESICALDFDPIFASQDSAASDLEIQHGERNFVHVKFLYPSTRKLISLDFETKQTPRGWRIKDIRYKNEHGISLRKLLEAYPYH